MRLLFGLDRVPSRLPFDHPRLPGVDVGSAPLRLNTVPLPPAVLGDAGDGHAARLSAMQAWLQSQCGDYAVAERRFMATYLIAVAQHIDAHRDALTAVLQPFGGLYAAEDWVWSAPRPLPRAWALVDGSPVSLGTVFWDGERAVPAQQNAPIPDLSRGEILPRSPFRRPPIGSPDPPARR